MEKINDSTESSKKRATIEVSDSDYFDEQTIESVGHKVASLLAHRFEDAVYGQSVNPSYLIDPNGLDKYFDHGSAEHAVLKDKFMNADNIVSNISLLSMAGGQKVFETKMIFYKKSIDDDWDIPFYELIVKVDEDGKVVGSIISTVK